MRFSRQEYWSGLPFPSPGDLLDPGIEHTSRALAGRFSTTEASGKPSDWVRTPPLKATFQLNQFFKGFAPKNQGWRVSR